MEDGASVFQQIRVQALRWGWPKSDKVSGLALKELRLQMGNESIAEEIEAVVRFQKLGDCRRIERMLRQPLGHREASPPPSAGLQKPD